MSTSTSGRNVPRRKASLKVGLRNRKPSRSAPAAPQQNELQNIFAQRRKKTQQESSGDNTPDESKEDTSFTPCAWKNKFESNKQSSPPEKALKPKTALVPNRPNKPSVITRSQNVMDTNPITASEANSESSHSPKQSEKFKNIFSQFEQGEKPANTSPKSPRAQLGVVPEGSGKTGNTSPRSPIADLGDVPASRGKIPPLPPPKSAKPTVSPRTNRHSLLPPSDELSFTYSVQQPVSPEVNQPVASNVQMSASASESIVMNPSDDGNSMDSVKNRVRTISEVLQKDLKLAPSNEVSIKPLPVPKRQPKHVFNKTETKIVVPPVKPPRLNNVPPLVPSRKRTTNCDNIESNKLSDHLNDHKVTHNEVKLNPVKHRLGSPQSCPKFPKPKVPYSQVNLNAKTNKRPRGKNSVMAKGYPKVTQHVREHKLLESQPSYSSSDYDDVLVNSAGLTEFGENIDSGLGSISGSNLTLDSSRDGSTLDYGKYHEHYLFVSSRDGSTLDEIDGK